MLPLDRSDPNALDDGALVPAAEGRVLGRRRAPDSFAPIRAGNLVVRAGSEFLLSRDDGESFTALPIEGFIEPEVAAKYADDTLYVVTQGTLYFAKLP